MSRSSSTLNDQLPSGDVCFLFTDVEGSTNLVRKIGDSRWATVQHTMVGIVREAVQAAGGVLVTTQGDGCFAALKSVPRAVLACERAQQQLAEQDWGEDVALRVRMGLHLGKDIEPRGGDYLSLAVHQAARVGDAARGGQVLATAAVVERCANAALFTDLGWFTVRDFDGPVRLYSLAVAGSTAPDLRPRVPPAFDGHIPRYRTALVGREREISAVLERLQTASLVTLLGPGGVGKTRLAVAAIAQAAGLTIGGAWFADLTTVHETAALRDALVKATACPPDTALNEHVNALLDRRPGILVVDNCEHVLDDAAATIDGMLSDCPDLHVLATSREALRLPDEVLYRVVPLDLPATREPASVLNSPTGRLFLERAQRVRPGIELTDTVAAAVSDILRAVDGLPLAIELAAALCAHQSPEQVGNLIVGNASMLGDGASPVRGRAPRHTSLAALVDWSLDLLTEDDQRAMAALAVPEPPISRALALAAVSALGVGAERSRLLLDILVARCLLEQGPDGSYRQLSIIRDYVRTRLAAADEAAVVQALLLQCQAATDDHKHGRVMAAVDPVAATATSLVSNPLVSIADRQDLAVRLTGWWVGRLGARRAREQLLEVLSLGGTGYAVAGLHISLAETYLASGEVADGEHNLAEASRILSSGEGRTEQANLLRWQVARSMMRGGDFVRARGLIDAAIPADGPERAPWLRLLGIIHVLDHKPALAEQHFREQRDLSSGVDADAADLNLANCLDLQGKTEEAGEVLQQLLTRDLDITMRAQAVHIASRVVALKDGHEPDALRLLAWSDRELGDVGWRDYTAEEELRETLYERNRRQFGPETYARLVADGQGWDAVTAAGRALDLLRVRSPAEEPGSQDNRSAG